MTEDLGCDVPGGVDLHAHACHFKGRPMLVLSQVLD
jgi:hypothetical protein